MVCAGVHSSARGRIAPSPRRRRRAMTILNFRDERPLAACTRETVFETRPATQLTIFARAVKFKMQKARARGDGEKVAKYKGKIARWQQQLRDSMGEGEDLCGNQNFTARSC